ncbi:MAG: ATP-binding protein [Candidatus Omnitrophica bacterium]|nr:ATP-binding protein [Candidatus Omnitrophota bacterium]
MVFRSLGVRFLVTFLVCALLLPPSAWTLRDSIEDDTPSALTRRLDGSPSTGLEEAALKMIRDYLHSMMIQRHEYLLGLLDAVSSELSPESKIQETLEKMSAGQREFLSALGHLFDQYERFRETEDEGKMFQVGTGILDAIYARYALLAGELEKIRDPEVGDARDAMGSLRSWVYAVLGSSTRLKERLSGTREPPRLVVLEHLMRPKFHGPWKAYVRTSNEDFKISLPPEPLQVRVDPYDFNDVIMNVLANARYAIEGLERFSNNQVEIVVARQGDRVRIDVRDNGPGISPELLEGGRLFVRGVTSKPAGEGEHGLGLAYVKDRVEEWGGTVEDHNLSEGGAEITIWLPLAAGPATEPSAAGLEGLESSEELGGKTVLSGRGAFGIDQWRRGLPLEGKSTELLPEQTTFSYPPFSSGASRQASDTQITMPATNTAFNPTESFPNRSPANAPANRILEKSASVLDNTSRRPSVNTDFFTTSIVPHSLNSDIAAGLEELERRMPAWMREVMTPEEWMESIHRVHEIPPLYEGVAVLMDRPLLAREDADPEILASRLVRIKRDLRSVASWSDATPVRVSVWSQPLEEAYRAHGFRVVRIRRDGRDPMRDPIPPELLLLAVVRAVASGEEFFAVNVAADYLRLRGVVTYREIWNTLTDLFA